MPEIIIHIGLHKTGTTALQTFFASNESVFNAHGVYFPHATRERIQRQIIHSNLSWELMRHDLFDKELGTLSDLIAEIRSRPNVRKWLISGEGLSRLKDPAAFLDQFRPHPITVIAYFRDPMEASPSLYTENLKAGCRLTYDEWITHKSSRRLNAYSIMKRWRSPLTRTGRLLDRFGLRQPALFGGISLKIIQRSISSLHHNNLKADFLLQLGLANATESFGHSKHSYSNPRISALECLGLIFLNTLHNANNKLNDREKINDRVEIRRALREAFPSRVKAFECTTSQRDAVAKIFDTNKRCHDKPSSTSTQEALDKAAVPEDMLNWMRQFKMQEYTPSQLDAAVFQARLFARQQASNDPFLIE